MIESIEIRGFKSIKALRLNLWPVNILIGSNGAGKSNFVSFFSFIHAIYEQQLAIYTAQRGGASRLMYLGRSITTQMGGKIKFMPLMDYDFRLTANDTDSFIFQYEDYTFSPDFSAVTVDPDLREGERFSGHRESEIRNQPRITSAVMRHNLESFRVYHFHDTSKDAPLKQTARVADTRFLRADGSNLAAILYDLQQNESQAFRWIEATIKRIAPYFERFDLQPSGNSDYIRLNWRQKGTDMYLDAADFSDGTLRFIALATLLLQPNPPTTILIDEPELGLHPYAISTLAGLIQSVSVRSQVIVSTQSVGLVNEFTPADIIVVENRDNESLFRRLDEADLADWLNDYTLGDLWQKNIIGGNP